MGSALHRLEILLVGLILALAGLAAVLVAALPSPLPRTAADARMAVPKVGIAVAEDAAAGVTPSAPKSSNPPLLSGYLIDIIEKYVSVQGVASVWSLLMGSAALGVAGWTARHLRRRRQGRSWTRLPSQPLRRLGLPCLHVQTLLTRGRIGYDRQAQWVHRLILDIIHRGFVTLHAQEQRAASGPPHMGSAGTLAFEMCPPDLAPRLPEPGAGQIVFDRGAGAGGAAGAGRPLASRRGNAAVTLAEPAAVASQRVGEAWTADDRVLAVAAALATAWAALDLRSTVRALDTARGDGAGDVVVMLEIEPADEAQLARLPAWIDDLHAGWQARWHDDRLVVSVPADAALLAGGPLLLPLLDHGRKHATTRFLPLDIWRHVAIRGDEAIGLLHAVLGSLLLLHAPERLALALLDGGDTSRLLRDVPHRVALPGGAEQILDTLLDVLRLGVFPPEVRPLLLVVIDPPAPLLHRLAVLLGRLRHHAAAPLHLLLVQSDPQGDSHELRALLPALVTAGGTTRWMPGAGRQEARRARLAAPGIGAEGRASHLDERAMLDIIGAMPQTTAALPPVLWDTMWHTAAVPAGAEAVGEPVPDASEAEPARESRRDAVRSDGAMVLLAPSIAAAPAGLSDDVAGLADTPRSPAADRLARLLDDQPLPAAGAADDARPDRAIPPDDPAWPRLAESLGGGALHDLFSRLLCDPAIVDGTFPGLTPRRVEKLLPPSARPLAAALLVWCDRAGLLDGPVTAHEPLRHPRRLLLADLDAIAARLRATPLPAEDEVRAALLGKGARS